VVVCGKWLGRTGIVSAVGLEEKMLAVAGHANTVSILVISYTGVDQHYFNRVVLSCQSRSLLTNAPYQTTMKLTTTKKRRSSSSPAIIRGGEEPFVRFPNIRAWSFQETLQPFVSRRTRSSSGEMKSCMGSRLLNLGSLLEVLKLLWRGES